MSDTLLIHYSPASLNADNTDIVAWALCNAQGELSTKINHGALNDIRASQTSEIANANHVVVLLDSRCLHFNQLQLPTQNTQKMLRAVPYALEEFIADDIDDIHFVIANNKQQKNTAVVGIHKQTLQLIIDTFSAAGITIDSLIADTLCLVTGENQWALLNFNNTCYLQTNTYSGNVFNQDLLPLFFEKTLQAAAGKTPEKLLVFSHESNEETEHLIQNLQPIISKYSANTSDNAAIAIDSDTQNGDNKHSTNQNTQIISIAYNSHPLDVFSGQYKQAEKLNLLQGQFKNKKSSSGNLQYWRLAASLAFIWLVLHLGLTGYQENQLAHKNADTLAEIKSIYKKTFPQSKRIVNPRVQMEQKLKELKRGANTENGLLFILSESFGTFVLNKKNIHLQSLNYRNNRMDIGLDSTNLQAIETLNKQLNSNAHIKSEITSSSSEKNRVKGNLRVESRKNKPSKGNS